MYASLSSWCRFPVIIHAYSGISGTGDESYDAPVICKGYPVEQMELIKDKKGEQYISNLRVYFPETVEVTENDLVTFPDNTVRYEIKKLENFYDGTTGKKDIVVVYL